MSRLISDEAFERLTKERDEALAKCAEMREALTFWNEMYPKELADADKQAELCAKENDTHGVNFFKGLRSGLISHDIFLSRIKHALSDDCGKGFVSVKELEPTIEFVRGVLEVCDFLDNADRHYTKHTQAELDRLKKLIAK